MNVKMKIDSLLESFQLYLHFQTDMYITFDIDRLIIHGVDNASYTKVFIEDEQQFAHYENSCKEKQTYEGK